MDRGKISISPAAAASLLQWWNDAGVDTLVDERPRDWLRAPAQGSQAFSLGPPPSAPEAETARPDALPGQLELFRGYLQDHHALPFASPSAKRVCPAGDPTSGLMIMTDMPAAEDCGTGTLISGEVGRLFDRMLAAIGRDRQSVYLASLSCLRSPDGRFTTGTAKECARLALHHIGLASPQALLVLGDACSKALLGLPMAQARGRWHDIVTHAGPINAIVTLSPSYLLTQPSAKALAWADLQLLMEGLNQ